MSLPNCERDRWLAFLGELHALCERHQVGMMGAQVWRRLPAQSPTMLSRVRVGYDSAEAVANTRTFDGETLYQGLVWELAANRFPDVPVGWDTPASTPKEV